MLQKQTSWNWTLVVVLQMLAAQHNMSTYVHNSDDWLVPNSYTKKGKKAAVHTCFWNNPNQLHLAYKHYLWRQVPRQESVSKQNTNFQVENQKTKLFHLWHVTVDQMMHSYLTGCPQIPKQTMPNISYLLPIVPACSKKTSSRLHHYELCLLTVGLVILWGNGGHLQHPIFMSQASQGNCQDLPRSAKLPSVRLGLAAPYGRAPWAPTTAPFARPGHPRRAAAGPPHCFQPATDVRLLPIHTYSYLFHIVPPCESVVNR